ncbi:AraC-like ligand binding domain-containing protein [Paenibacillus sp. 1_12]|uniref:helix-turn-helix transcriptional regulator n=1 Tax=Paenibacillus sp. 1_12 TaxID=1566278 RepID=UPI0008E7E977|nr:helix-turn-helix domain-containing protein [Paenibacillus sp. 1_12]SFM15712.1 AraC-like ligand binding domain-containing protein [Paenibacillus sp. 1_12]
MPELFALSRLARLDVKWAKRYLGSLFAFNHNEHCNPFFELLIVFEGPIYLQVGLNKLELLSGEWYLLQPWETHTMWREVPDSAGFFWAQFTADPSLRSVEDGGHLAEELKSGQLHRQDLRTSEFIAHDPLWIPRRHVLERRYEILSLFEQLLDYQNDPRGFFRFNSTLLLGQILSKLAGQFLEQSVTGRVIPASFATYRAIVRYLDEYYYRSLTRDTLEKQFHHNYVYLCQLFKKYAGISMQSYIRELRVERAKYLLDSSSQSIAHIAGQVGFSDPYYFSKVFKAIAGLSPNEFRRNSGPSSCR